MGLKLKGVLQIGIGEGGGVRSLLAAIGEGSQAQSALAAKALASVVGGTPSLQEVLLDSGGANVLTRHLDAPQTPQADTTKGEGSYLRDCNTMHVCSCKGSKIVCYHTMPNIW